MATSSELEGWKLRMKDIRLRLLRPEGLSQEERYKLEAELMALDRLTKGIQG